MRRSTSTEVTRFTLATLPETDLRILGKDSSIVEMPSAVFRQLGVYFSNLLDCEMPLSEDKKQRVLDLTSHTGLFDLLSCVHLTLDGVTRGRPGLTTIRHCFSPLEGTVSCNLQRWGSQEVARYTTMQLAAEMVEWKTVSSRILFKLGENIPYEPGPFRLLFKFAHDHDHKSLEKKIVESLLEGSRGEATLSLLPDDQSKQLLLNLVSQIKDHNTKVHTAGHESGRKSMEENDEEDE